MDNYTALDSVRKKRFEKRKESFITGNFNHVWAYDEKNNYSKKLIKKIIFDETIQHADIDIHSFSMQLKLDCNKAYRQLPRQRSIMHDLEEHIVSFYFNDDLEQWNSYLQKLEREYGSVHPLGVCYYMQEMGFNGLPSKDVYSPEKNNGKEAIDYTSRAHRNELRKRIRQRKREEMKQKKKRRKK